MKKNEKNTSLSSNLNINKMSDNDEESITNEDQCVYCLGIEEKLINYEHNCGKYKIHQKCLDEWMSEYGTSCIICRKDILDNSTSTPNEPNINDITASNSIMLNNLINQAAINIINQNTNNVNQVEVVIDQEEQGQVVIDQEEQGQVAINQEESCVCCNAENRGRSWLIFLIVVMVSVSVGFIIAALVIIAT